MPAPTLSIIIPAYNTGESINQMVSSVLDQSFTDFELILVDDGSTDDTLRILSSLTEKDSRIRIFTKENGGPSSARNFGLDQASGKYIQFYDADDQLAKGALQKIIDTAIKHESDMVVSGWQIDLQTKNGVVNKYKVIRPDRKAIDKDIRQSVIRSIGSEGTLYNLWNKLLRADIIQENNLRFREDLRFGEDVIFALEYMNFVSRIDIISEVTYRYQVGSSTSVFSKSSLVPEYRHENDQAIIRFAGDNPSPEEFALLQWVRWRWLMSYWSLVAASGKKVGEKLELLKQFQPNGLNIVHDIRQIGFKKYFMILAANTARSTALGSLAAGWCSNLLKKIIITTKTTLKKQRDV